MPWVDSLSASPRDELRAAFQKTLLMDYSSRFSIAGRIVCIQRLFLHSIGIFLKPALYFTVGATYLLSLWVLKNQEPYKSCPSEYKKDWKFGRRLFCCTFTASLGQFILLFKAALGILNPRVYFKENALKSYFIKLSKLALEAGNEIEFVALLKNGGHIIQKSIHESHPLLRRNALFAQDLKIQFFDLLKFAGDLAQESINANTSHKHYYVLFEQHLKLMCEKFDQPGYSKEKIATSLATLLPDSGEVRSGLNSRPAALNKLFKKINAAL